MGVNMTPEDIDIAIQFEKVDKHMREAVKAVTIAMFLLLLVILFAILTIIE